MIWSEDDRMYKVVIEEDITEDETVITVAYRNTEEELMSDYYDKSGMPIPLCPAEDDSMFTHREKGKPATLSISVTNALSIPTRCCLWYNRGFVYAVNLEPKNAAKAETQIVGSTCEHLEGFGYEVILPTV